MTGSEPIGDSIAIIGLAGRFPGARDVAEFWKNLLAGKDCLTKFSDEQLAAAGYDPAALRALPGFVGVRGVVEKPEWFDRAFFGIPPKEAEVMDPQQRVFLEIAWDALEDAGCDPARFAGLIGVFAGMSNNTYFPFFVRLRPDLLEAVGMVSAVIANEKDFLTPRLAYRLNLRGPALNIQTACSSSLVAVCVACQSLLEHQCDVALAGGVSLTFPQERGYFFQEGGMTSADGRCAPFDAGANGTVFSSGAGVVVLKRLADAVADGDQIYAVLKGHALNNDGARKVSFAAPSVDGHAEVIALAQAVAGVAPDTISYIEAHGTATPLGDPIEIAGLTQVFRAATDRKQFCPVGSVKGNIGHLDAASGVASLIKTALALRHGLIPPSLHCDVPNPALQIEESPFFINTALREWPCDAAPRRAGVSSFGVGGTNAHVVLEEAPSLATTSAVCSPQVLVLSAKTATALEQRARDLATHFESHPDLPLADAAFTLQVGRQVFQHRRAVVARINSDAVAALRASGKQSVDDRADTPLAFLFSGQGAQYPRMGARLHESEPAFRAALDECAEILRADLGLDLREILFSEDARLRETRFTQPAIFSTNYALARLWMSRGVQPAALLGHSVGEFAAATIAGVFSLEDAAHLVAARARLVQALPPGAMLAVRLGESDAREFLSDERVALAAINSPRLCVLSGPMDAIETIEGTLKERSVAARRLATSHAFHSPMVEPIVAPFTEAVRAVRLSEPRMPIVSSVTGDWMSDAQATDPQYWAGHLRATVRFADAVGCLLADEKGYALLETGPGQTLTQLTAQHAAKTRRHEIIHSIAEGADEDDSLAAALGRLWLAGVPIDWTLAHRGETRRRVSLPGYPFERQRYFADLPPGTPVPIVTAATDGECAAQACGAQASLPAEGPQASSLQSCEHTNSDNAALDRLKHSLAELSGMDLSAVPASASLLELGFDSLFLSQAALTLSRKFGVKVTFRQLLQETSTLESLAAHLQSSHSRSSNVLIAGSSRGVSGGEGAAGTSCDEGVAATPHGPFRPMQRELTASLTERQRRWLEDFIRRYTARTAKSKKHTQEHRPHFADPRAVAGFKQAWKEMVYPLVVERSAGAKLWDLDGNEWTDVTLSYGAAMLGHQPPFVIDAISAQLTRGMEIGPTSPLAGEVARLLCEITGMERATFCNTGSEAVTGALRIARTVTGRSRIAYFSESYHGIDNEVLGRRGGAGIVPIAPGIPPEATAGALILDYGDPRALDAIAAHAGELAAVLVEPVQSRRPELQPRDFLHALRALTAKHGIALIFDEVITGFRCHPGGAQAHFGVRADIATYGKVIGGGLPIGAIAGRAEYMDAFDGGVWSFGDDSFPSAAVTFFAGTFVRHPLALASARAVLQHLRQGGAELQRALTQRTADLIERVGASLAGSPFEAHHFASNWYVQTAAGFKYGSLLFALLRHRGIHIWEGRPAFVSTAHSDADLDRVAASFEESIAELADAGFFTRKAEERRRPRAAMALPREDCGAPSAALPLTEGQRELWVVSQHSANGNTACNETWALHLDGALDLAALRGAVQAVVDRHDALRCTFAASGESLLIRPRLALDVAFTEERLASICAAESSRVFDLQRGPLVAASVVRLAPERHVFVFNAHHLVCDGWSCDVFLGELAAIYSAAREGRPHGLPRAMQMSEYQRWERAMHDSQEFSADAEFWLEQYRTPPPVLHLPGDRPHPSWRSYRGACEELLLPAEFPKTLGRLGAQHGATLFTVLLAGFKALLFRLSGEADLVVGVPSSGQNLVGGDHLIGHCVNMLPLRSRLSATQTFAELLRAVQTTVLEAFEHRRVTFGWLLQKLTLPRVPGRVPLIPVTFNLDPPLSRVRFAGLAHRIEANPRTAYQFDLGFNCDTSPAGFRIACNYNADIFDPATIQRWLAQYRELLDSMLEDATRSCGVPDAVSSSGVSPLVPDEGIHRIFEAQVERAPDAVAIVDGSEEIRYFELNACADQLAGSLRSQGVVRGDCVGLCMERSSEAIVAMLGILKCGAAYVPMDPAYPVERLSHMIAETRAVRVLRSCDAPSQEVPAAPPPRAMHSRRGAAGTSCDEGVAATSGADLAYVMFTSGSTGSPKGVAIAHRGIARLVLHTDYVQLTPDDVVAQASTIAFDAATFEIWGALLNGARLVITPRETLLSAEALKAHCLAHGVTTLFLTTALFNELSHARNGVFTSIKHLLFGGEKADARAVERVLGNGRPQRLLHMYGPTEATTFATWHEIKSMDGDGVPIGRPIANTTLHLLDGEIYLGGPGLARGYLGAPALTAERFVETPHGRLYRTGDLARMRPDRALEFLGRADRQIKLRGFRIEPGEIEAAIESHREVRRAVVVARDSELIGYLEIEAGGGLDDDELRASLRRKLPAYMIPSVFPRLAAMPLTPSGKLNVAALPSPAPTASAVKPRNAIEASVAAIWEDLLGRNSFSVRDDFFALGGHSFRAIQLLSRVREKFAVDMPVRVLFESPTIEAVATFISAHLPPPNLPSLVPIQRGDDERRPFFLVSGGWGGELEFLVYKNLARHLDPSQPLYGLKARGADGIAEPHEDVFEMAHDYLDEIRTRQPHGPYLLGGECVGGVVAFEMARMLEAQGETVNLLVLLDTEPPSRSALRRFLAEQRAEERAAFWETRVRQPIGGHLKKLSCLTLGGKAKYLWTRLTRRRASCPAIEQRKLLADYPAKLMSHTLGVYGGKIALLIDERSHAAAGTLGWERVATGGLEVHVLPGDHISYIRENATHAAAKLGELIERVNEPAAC